MISLTVFWCLLGLYAKNLAYRLYNSSKFLEMVRLHAKVSFITFIPFFSSFLKTFEYGNSRATPPPPCRKWALNCVVLQCMSGDTRMACIYKRPCSTSNLLVIACAQTVLLFIYSIYVIYSDDIKSQCGLRFLPADDDVRGSPQYFSILHLVCWSRNVFSWYIYYLQLQSEMFRFYFIFCTFHNSWHHARSLPNTFYCLVHFFRLCYPLEFTCWNW